MPCFRHKHYYTHTKKKCKLFFKKIKKIFNPNYRNIYKPLKIKEKMRSWLLKFSYECILKKVLRPEVYKQLAAGKQMNCKADIRNPLSLLAHERSRFANCQWELLTPTDISISLTHRLVLYTFEGGIAYSAFKVHSRKLCARSD